MKLDIGFANELGTKMEARTAPCEPDEDVWHYQYTIKDHLGNTRVLFYDGNNDGSISSSEILNEEHYYPFGMSIKGDWQAISDPDFNYRYNGKEMHDDHGLDWYAYDFRFYDPAIGRFTGVDPISDQFPHVTTYNYAENSPIAFIDLHGLQKYKPKMQPIDKPSDLLSTKMLNNFKKGIKTVVIELGYIAKDGLNNLTPNQEQASNVDGGMAGSAENGMGNETRTNQGAENVELDEFTSGAGPKHPAGVVAASARAGIKLGKEAAEQLQENEKETEPRAEATDSICNSCTKEPHGLPYRRLDSAGNPIDTINPSDNNK